MNDQKRIGRPRGFVETDALKAAMNTFWAKGYDGTSVKDLAMAMGVKAPSIYATFGDKRELFLKTIDLYTGALGCAPIEAFEAEPDIEIAVRNFLTTIIQHATTSSPGMRGCYLASCVSANIGEVAGVAERLEQALENADRRFVARFETEVKMGHLPKEFPTKMRGRLLHDMRQGYVFRARVGWPAERMLEDVTDHVRIILGPSTG